MRRLALILILLLLVPPALGEGDQKLEVKFGERPQLNLLEPIADLLSGPIWFRLKSPNALREELTQPGLLAPPSPVLQAAPAALLPYREPSPAFSRTIIVSYDLGRFPFQVEPSIAVNPTFPDNVIVAAIDYQFFGLVAYRSIDGGLTWEGPRVVRPLFEDFGTADPIVRFNRTGTAYYAYMSIGTKPLLVANLVVIAEISKIVVSLSTDGGVTWTLPVVAAEGNVTYTKDGFATGENVIIRFLDKPWMAIGPDPENPDRDNIYITYTEFLLRYPVFPFYPFIGAPLVEVTIKLVASKDGGQTWSEPVAVSPTYKSILGELYRPVVQGSMPTVAPDGTLYVGYYDSLDDGPWRGEFALMVARSTDGGASFGQPVEAARMPEMDFWLRPTLFRAWSSMFAYMDTGPNGEVYLVFGARPPDKPQDEGDIYLVRSLDQGRRWSKPVRVNDDPTFRGQFFPNIAVSRNGTIHIMWGDKRDDPFDVKYHIYYARSTDGGKSFDFNARVSDFPSNSLQGFPEFIGDYFDIAVEGEGVYLVWVDTRVGIRGVANEDIAFARVKPVANPSIFISPPSGPAGEMVTIMGFNFAPNREVFIDIDGVVVSSLVTNEEGRFTTTLFLPVAGEGAHTIRAIDVTGNLAEASVYTEFGFNTLQEQFDRVVKELGGDIAVINKTLGQVLEELAKPVGSGMSEAPREQGSETPEMAETTPPPDTLSELESRLKAVETAGQQLGSRIDQLGDKIGRLEGVVSQEVAQLSSLVWTLAAIAIAALVASVLTLLFQLKRARVAR
jgi:hypothetical protein